MNFLSELIRNIRVSDILDILIVACFAFVFINWLRTSASRRLVITISVFAVIYFLAQFFKLYLTEVIIKSLIIVILIAAIIVFQSDIRRMIDLAWFWTNFRRRGRVSSYAPIVDVLTESLGKMADRRTGALIVIRGKESCERHLTGGITLDGKISSPLLYSIFNTSSPGHDGALIIEGDKISRFGAHLPLSININALGEGSTRHAAGLGLSERCDAFVIILSEERGTITTAENGKLTILKSTVELKHKLENFYEKNFPQIKESGKTRWNRRNVLTVSSSLIIAVLAWFFFAYHSDRIFRNYTVPIEFRNISADYSISSQVPSKAEVTLEGSEQDFRSLEPSELVISLDLNNIKKGKNEYALTEQDIELPAGITFYNVEPEKMTITATPTKTVSIPVKVQTIGRLPDNLRLISLEAIPATVLLITQVDKNGLPKLVYTEPVDMNKITNSTTIKTHFLIPADLKLPPEEESDVEVRIIIKKG